MQNRVKKYVDDLFADIYETKQLRELKEEISSNLLEKINDYMTSGDSEDTAFKKAVSSLGDMSELVDSLKKASEEKIKAVMNEDPPLDKKHIFGYVIASTVLLLGLMLGGITYFQQNNVKFVLTLLMPFVLVSVPIYIYLGLTQESSSEYGMEPKRAFAYSLASEILLFGLFIAGITWLSGLKPYMVLSILIPFVIPSVAIFIYLGLTERSRIKMNAGWQNYWVDYYSNPRNAMIRGTISGVLWILAITAFLVGGFAWSWKYSWVALAIATALEILIEGVYISKLKK